MRRRGALVLSLAVFAVAVGGAELPAYRAGAMHVNAEGYTVQRLFEVAWGTGADQVGQCRLNSRGALSYSPRYISVASSGVIYLADEVNQRILRFGADGTFLSSFPAAYGGYHLFVDDKEDVYTLFRRPLEPFAIAVYREGKLVGEIEVPPVLRNPNGDRVWLDCHGALFLHYNHSHQPLVKLTEPRTETRRITNYLSGESWEFGAEFRKAELGPVTKGYLSRHADKVYVVDEAGVVSVNDRKGEATARIDVRALVTEEVGIEQGANLGVARAIRVFGEDPDGDLYLVVRNRLRRPGISAFSIVKVSPDGRMLLAADCYPCEIHYGSEVQFYPSTLTVDRKGCVYQLCTDEEKGVHVIKFVPSGE